MALLVRFDSIVLAHQEAKLVDAVHEAVLGEGVDREFDILAIGQDQPLPLPIDRDAGLGFLLDQADELVVGFLVDADRDQAVLERVVGEDVGAAITSGPILSPASYGRRVPAA